MYIIRKKTTIFVKYNNIDNIPFIKIYQFYPMYKIPITVLSFIFQQPHIKTLYMFSFPLAGIFHSKYHCQDRLYFKILKLTV